MGYLRNGLCGLTLFLASMTGCKTADDYFSYRNIEQPRKERRIKTDFDNENVNETESTSKNEHKLYINEKNWLSDKYQKYNLNCKGVFDLGKDHKFIVYGVGSHTDTRGEPNKRSVYTNRGDLDARVGKYIKAGKNVLVYVELGARAEIFAYNSESEMQYWAAGGMFRCGMKIFDDKTDEQLTKLQLDALVMGGQYDWRFSKSKLEESLLRIAAQLKANQKLIDIGKIARINLVAGVGYGNRDFRDYRRDQTVSGKGGIEGILNKKVLGFPVRVSLNAFGRREFGQPYHGSSTNKTYCGIEAGSEFKLTEGLKFLLNGGYDGEKGGFVEAGIKIEW